jgi:quinolinate synthase
VKALTQLKADNPGALVVAHPECPQDILAHADHIGSTRSLLDFVISTQATEIIVATEPNLIHQMHKAVPHQKHIPVPATEGGCDGVFCPFMALNTMEKLYLCLVNEAPRIEMPESLIVAARKPLERMLQLSPPAKSSTAQR